MIILQIVLTAAALFLISGTVLNFSKHAHWYIRAWDFPRVFVAAVSAVVAVLYAAFFHNSAWDIFIILGLVAVTIRQLYMIYPYTPVAPLTVKESSRPPGDYRLSLLMSNVLMENRDYEKWLNVVKEADPDIIVAVELDQKWVQAIKSLEEYYPYNVQYPLDNHYGMAFFSKLRFDNEPEIKFIVQDDIPSIHATVVLKDGQQVHIHALHPRPPEPVSDQDSAPRDAELVILGREIANSERRVPVVACGDLNDVAWSYTTQLFLRLSKLLDPRMGRGLYNSFNANSRIFRYPLDHVFHSDELKLVRLQVLNHVGSDHFPVLIELSCDPDAALEQDETESQYGDQQAAEDLVDEQVKREVEGEEEGHVATDKGNA